MSYFANVKVFKFDMDQNMGKLKQIFDDKNLTQLSGNNCNAIKMQCIG
jgi:hypothetical protein